MTSLGRSTAVYRAIPDIAARFRSAINEPRIGDILPRRQPETIECSDKLGTIAQRGAGKDPVNRRWIRIALLAASALLAVVLVIVLGGMRLYVFPHEGTPIKSEAIVVIGPPNQDRIQYANQLIAEGYASRLYISIPAAGFPSCPTTATCFKPSPFKTRGEAKYTNEMAAAHGWKNVIVITGTFHVSRARYIFDRCATDTSVQVLGVHEHLTFKQWVYQYEYQTAAFVKAFFVGCA